MHALAATEPHVRRWLAERGGAFTVIGVAGAQGSGKSTLVRQLADRLAADGLKVAALSLDDLYRTRAERQALARDIHPLFATRGVPGTHDVALGLATIDALARGEAAPLPRFDKGNDDRLPQGDWPLAPVGTQVLLLEGWCLAAAAQGAADLARPVNPLEANEDPDGTWRRHANAALARDYPALWALENQRAVLLKAQAAWQAMADRAIKTAEERDRREAGRRGQDQDLTEN